MVLFNKHIGKPGKIYVFGSWLHLALNAIWLTGFSLSLFCWKTIQGLIYQSQENVILYNANFRRQRISLTP